MGHNHPARTIAAILGLGCCDPKRDLHLIGMLAVLVAFLSASQDIVIDAYRVELLGQEQQGPGAGMIQTGYRIGMLIAGAGALIIASHAGWFAAYATMAALIGVGMLIFLFAPEPAARVEIVTSKPGSRCDAFRQWLATAVTGPFADFMRRPLWVVILIFILGYKLGEAMAGVMAMPLYVCAWLLTRTDRRRLEAGRFLRDRRRSAGRWSDHCPARSSTSTGRMRRTAIGWQSVLCVTSGRGPSTRLPRTLRCGGKPYRCDGGCGAGRLSLGPMLSRFHRHSVRLAVFARRSRAHNGCVIWRRTSRQVRVGAILLTDYGSDHASSVAAYLDSQAHRRAIRTSGSFARGNWLVSCRPIL